MTQTCYGLVHFHIIEGLYNSHGKMAYPVCSQCRKYRLFCSKCVSDSYISLQLLSLPAKRFPQFIRYKSLQNEREPDIMLSKIVIYLAIQYHPYSRKRLDFLSGYNLFLELTFQFSLQLFRISLVPQPPFY